MKIPRQKTLGTIGEIAILLNSYKMVVGVKYKIMSLFKRNTTENYSKPPRVKYVYGGRKKSR